MGKVLTMRKKDYAKILESLRKKEKEMGSFPILKDWFAIKNKIRRIERLMKEARND